MRYKVISDREAILALEGDQRCVDGCPHLELKKPCPKKPPTGYCAFYGVWLRKYDILTGWVACPACQHAGETEDEEEERT